MVDRRRFTATQQTTVRDLYRVMTQIGATSLKINQDVMTGKVEVIFDRAGLRYVVRGEKWGDSIDNLRAVGLTIMYLYRAIEVWGATIEEAVFDDIFTKTFGGFIATPDDSVLMLGDGSQPWHEVLGVPPNADAPAIRNAYRALAKIHHPDNGGVEADFKKLRAAYDQGMRVAKPAKKG